MDKLQLTFSTLAWFVGMCIIVVIVAMIVLMLARLALNYADLNPFSWPVLRVRQLTDPFVNPVRRALVGFGFNPNFAPLLTILITILLGWLTQQLAVGVINTIYKVTVSALQKRPVLVVGYLLDGLLGLYLLLIFARIIFSWGQVSYANRIMRFLVRTTEPLLGPLRRIVPTIGFIDISPIVAYFIITLFQVAIEGTLLRQ